MKSSPLVERKVEGVFLEGARRLETTFMGDVPLLPAINGVEGPVQWVYKNASVKIVA